MSITHARWRERYTMVANVSLEDPRLSWRARGLLVYLLSKPDTWRVLITQLVSAGPDGYTVVRNTLTELEEAGYVIRDKVRDPSGTFDGWTTEVIEDPTEEPQVGTSRGSTECGQTDLGETTASKTLIPVSTEVSKTRPLPFEADFREAYAAYPRGDGKKAAHRAYVAQRRKGASAADLLAACQKMQIDCRGTDTKYIKLMATFLGPNDWWREKLGNSDTDVESPVTLCPTCGLDHRGAPCPFEQAQAERG
jgi:hypothetical protein